MVDCKTVLNNQHSNTPFNFELTPNSGMVTLFNSWNEFIVNSNVAICAVSKCTVSYYSGTDFSSCISTPATYNSNIGLFRFNTDLANCRSGSGTVRLNCAAGTQIPVADMTSSKVISISFVAPCSDPALITP